jgi:alpha-tubulin suppressor-like RCC1 family protein
MNRTVFSGILFATALSVGACDRAPTEPAVRVASLEIVDAKSPSILSVLKGQTLQMTAIARDSAGNVLADSRIGWSVQPTIAQQSSGNAGEATIDSKGKVTGVSRGWVTVTASAGNQSTIAYVYVRNAIASITFGLDSLRLIVGDARKVTVTAYDTSGVLIPLQIPLSISASEASVASFDGVATVTALGAGRTVITAGVDGIVAALPVRVSFATFASLAKGSAFACGLTEQGDALCWGKNNSSQLGIVTPRYCVGGAGQYCAQSASAVPVYVSGSLTFTRLSAGYLHVCGLTASKAAYCWGNGGDGKLGTAAGIGTCTDLIDFQGGACSATPLAVTGGLNFDSISASRYHTCALTPAGVGYCWGQGFGGKLGNGSTASSASPVPVSGGLVFRSISAGFQHSCGVTTAGEAYCWGRNVLGELGIGASDSVTRTMPTRVSGGLSFSYVGAGASTTCGLSTDGRVYCWGSANYIGLSSAPETCPPVSGSTTQPLGCATSPVPVESDLTFTLLAVAESSACALTASGSAYCWNYSFRVPTAVAVAPLRSVSVAYFGDGCGLTISNVAYCWGGFDLVAKRVPGQP